MSNKVKVSDDTIKATLKALLNKDSGVTAINGGNYLTTRLSNTILWLRNQKIDIITKRINLENRKWYGVYVLVNSKANREKAKRLLHYYENIDKVINAIDTTKN